MGTPCPAGGAPAAYGLRAAMDAGNRAAALRRTVVEAAADAAGPAVRGLELDPELELERSEHTPTRALAGRGQRDPGEC